jgi:hypothetical protein
MKRLLLFVLMLVTVVLAGVLQGNYIQQESVEGISLKVAYGACYPQGILASTLIPTTTIPF